MELNQIKTFFKQRWLIILLVAVVFCIAGAAYGFTKKPQYSSSGTLYVSAAAEKGSTLNQLQAGQAAQAMTSTYADLINTGAVEERIADKLGDGTTVQDIQHSVTAKARKESVLIDITATGQDPQYAQRLADASLEVMGAYVAEISKNSASDEDKSDSDETYYVYENGEFTVAPKKSKKEGKSAFYAEKLNVPQVPTAPSSPSGWSYAAGGLLLGLILGFFLALIIHFADRRLRTAEDVDAIVDLPLLATVPEDATLKDKKLADFESGYSRTAEAYREMAVNLSYMGIDKDSKTVMITSPDAECGKTVTTINAASALVEAGHKVVVAELDLRRPKVADYLGIEQGRGLSSLLNSDMATEDAIITRDDGLSVLPAGNSLPNPTEILSSHRLEVLLDELKKDFDYVVLDTSPVLVAADAVAVAKHVDGTVIVVNAGRTSQDQLVKTVSALEKVKAPIFGILLGRAKLRAKKSHYNYQPEPQGSKA